MHILITGATGFLGGAVVAEFLAKYPEQTLLLLVRAATAADGLARVRDALRRFEVP